MNADLWYWLAVGALCVIGFVCLIEELAVMRRVRLDMRSINYWQSLRESSQSSRENQMQDSYDELEGREFGFLFWFAAVCGLIYAMLARPWIFIFDWAVRSYRGR